MKLTLKQIKQIIKEELEGMQTHPMVAMASDILSVAYIGEVSKDNGCC